MAPPGKPSTFRNLWGRLESHFPQRTHHEPVQEPENSSANIQESLESRLVQGTDPEPATEREQLLRELISRWNQDPKAVRKATSIKWRIRISSLGFIDGECENCLFPFWGIRNLPSGCEEATKVLDEREQIYCRDGLACPGCKLFNSCFDFLVDAFNITVPTMYYSQWFALFLEWKSSPIRIHYEPREALRSLEGRVTQERRKRILSSPQYLDLFLDQAHRPVANLSRASKISTSTASMESLKKAKKWLVQCSKNHKLCRQQVYTKPGGSCLASEHNSKQSLLSNSPKSAFVPRRLIEVGKEGGKKVRLVETSQAVPVSYVCLSHCWGRHALRCLTTKDTIDSHMKKIYLQVLPKTFREAIEITRQLGFQYLWIDSMCIIQYDDEDWREQSSAMASIFQNAYLTIAAAWSSDDEGGLYSEALPLHVGFSYAWTAQDNIHVRAHMWHPYEPVPGPQPPMPLLTRAWVWQERLLSRRLLYFGANELLWECIEGTACECESWEPEETSGMTKRDFSSLQTNACTTSMINGYWRIVVQNYSALDLTFPRDRLPALSGVAKVFQEASGDDYLAGLWRSNLASDLGWRLASFPRQRRLHSSAPTWSWASVSGAVYWLNWGTDEFRVLAATTTPIGSDSTGEIREGAVSVNGLIFPIRLELQESITQTSKDTDVETLEIFQMRTRESKADCDSVTIHPDYVFWDSTREFMDIVAEHCHCFILGMGTMYGSVPALLLRRVESQDGQGDLPRYQRLGVMHMNVPSRIKVEWRPQDSERRVFEMV